MARRWHGVGERLLYSVICITNILPYSIVFSLAAFSFFTPSLAPPLPSSSPAEGPSVYIRSAQALSTSRALGDVKLPLFFPPRETFFTSAV